MTAQIAILNKKGVALVADNTAKVTLDDFTMETAVSRDRHIFQLDASGQIGILAYGEQSFPPSQIEKLVREYRLSQVNSHHNHLDDYIDSFLAFLQKKQPEHEIANGESLWPADEPGSQYREYEVYSSKVIPGEDSTPERISFELRAPSGAHIQTYNDAAARVGELEKLGGILSRMRLMRARSALDKARERAELLQELQRDVSMIKPADNDDPYDIALYENLCQLQPGEHAFFQLSRRPDAGWADMRYSYITDLVDIPNAQQTVLRTHFPEGYEPLYRTRSQSVRYRRFVNEAETVFRRIGNDIFERLAVHSETSDIRRREVVGEILAEYVARIENAQKVQSLEQQAVTETQDYIRSVVGRIRRNSFGRDRYYLSAGYRFTSNEIALLDMIAVGMVPVAFADVVPPLPGYEYYLGVAFVGFGRQDVLPSCVELRITGLEFDGSGFHQTKMGWTRRREVKISEENKVSMLSFEPSGMTDFLAQGMEASHIVPVGEIAHKGWEEFSQELINVLRESTQDEKNVAKSSDLWQRYVWGNVMRDEMLEHDSSVRSAEIMAAASKLDERELVMVVETRLDLTSGWKKPYDKEKADKQRDVVLITKADGMQWIRRGK